VGMKRDVWDGSGKESEVEKRPSPISISGYVTAALLVNPCSQQMSRRLAE